MAAIHSRNRGFNYEVDIGCEWRAGRRSVALKGSVNGNLENIAFSLKHENKPTASSLSIGNFKFEPNEADLIYAESRFSC